MKRFALALALLLPLSAFAQQATLTNVKVRINDEKERRQVDKDAALSLDDASRRLVVKSKERPLELNYDDVQKIIIELDSHSSRTGFGAGLLASSVKGRLFGFGDQVAASIENPLKANHLVYVEHKDRDGKTNPFVLILDKDSAPAGLKRIKAAFGDRVVLPAFEGTREKVDKKQFTSAKSRFQVRGSAQEHPLPDARPDKALVVVATPTGWAAAAPADQWNHYARSIKILVNDQVIAVNATGTFTYFHVDPGEHLLVSQADDITGLKMKLEAGKDYYMTQTFYFEGSGSKSFLARHSKEVVLHEIRDLLWSEWKPMN